MKKNARNLLIIAGCIFASFAISDKATYADKIFPDEGFAYDVLLAYNRVNEAQVDNPDEMTDDGLSEITELSALADKSTSGIEKLTGLKGLLIRGRGALLEGEEELQKIDLSKNTSLQNVIIRDFPGLDEVIFPDSSSLKSFEISNCASFQELDLSTYNNLSLTWLKLGSNSINNLVLPKNTSELETIHIRGNNIETLDLSSLSDNFTHARFMYTDSLKQIILPADWENNPDRDLEDTLQFSPEELRNQVTITYAKKPATDEDTPKKDEEDTTKVPNTGVGITDMANKIAIYITPFIFGIFIISRRAYKANKKRVRFSR